MENLRFRDIPALTLLPLPFDANEKELGEWLNSLSVFPNEVAAEKILLVSHAIAQLEGKADVQIRLLQKILQHFHELTETLQKIYQDASQPLERQPTQQVELVVWNYLKIARTLLDVVRLNRLKLTKEQQILAVYLCMEALNYVQLHTSLSYRMPMQGFWLLAYEVYRYAEHTILLSQEVNRRGYFSVYNAENTSVTIEKSFKQLLLVHLTDMQQFRSRDMLMVFQFLMGYSMKATLLSGYQSEWKEGVCVFYLNQDKPPQRIFDEIMHDDSFVRFVAPIAVAKSMYEALQQKTTNTLHRINYEVMLRAVNALGMGRKRKFKRIAQTSACSGVLGFADLVAYLQSKSTSTTTSTFTRPVEKNESLGIWQTHQFDLVPAGEEVLYQMHQTYKNDIRMNTPLGKLIKAGTEQNAPETKPKQAGLFQHDSIDASRYLEIFEMQDSSAKGYGLLTNYANTHVKIGDVMGLFKENSGSTEIGLIRRINHIQAHSLRLGVEMISFDSELVHVSSESDPASHLWAIFLPGVESIKQADTLLYSSSTLKIGGIVTLSKQGREQRYRLQKIVQMTSAVVQVEIQML